MKKALTLLLALALVFSLAACTGAPVTPESSVPGENTTTTVTTADSSDPTDGVTDPTNGVTDPTNGVTDPTAENPTTGNNTTTGPSKTDKPVATTTVTTKAPVVTTKPPKTAEEIYNSLKRADRDCEEYQLSKYMQSLWTEQITYNETFLPVRNKDGSLDPIQLMFPADKVLALHDASCNYTYFEGKDFTVENGCIVITENSGIRVLDWDDYYVSYNSGMGSYEEGRWLHFGEGATFHSKQYAVSYIHTETWTDTSTMPVNKANLLPKTYNKLKNKQELNVVLTGDSISCGGNASGHMNLGPYAPGWDKILIQYWENAFKTKINFRNIAEGGTTSPRGVELIPDTVYKDAGGNVKQPDLVIIGFGMNDSTWSTSTDTFINNIQKMIEGIRKNSPNCEFILMSSMRSNPLEKPNRSYMLDDYREALYALECEGIVVADITATHDGLLTRKHYADMTGNNINHQNDFLNRVYSQTVGFLLTKDGI